MATDYTTLQVLSALRLPILRRRLRVILALIAPGPCKLALFLINRPLFWLRVFINHLVTAAHTRAHTRQPTTVLLARVLPVMPELSARLSLSRVSRAGVHITGGSPAEGRGCGRLGGFFAVVTLDGGVVGLAWHFGCSVGFKGAVGGGGAGGKGFGAELWSGIVAD